MGEKFKGNKVILGLSISLVLWCIYVKISVICQYFQGPLDPKDGAASVGTSQTPAYYPYEYTFGQYPYDRYG